MEDRMKYWSKSALSVYRYLEQMANTIDKVILDSGKNSNHLQIQKYQTTLYQTRKMIELMERKRKMINLKVAVEDALQRMTKKERRLLCLVFIDGVKHETVTELLGVSIRTFFRRKAKALEHFNEKMIECGYNINFFECEYSTEKWLLSVYEESVHKYNKDEENLDYYLVNRMIKEVSKIKLLTPVDI